LGQIRGLKIPWAGEEDVFLVHHQNSLNSLILNWCIDGCWFTPALNSGVGKYWGFQNSVNQGRQVGGKPIQNLSVELLDLPVKLCWV
jgi:hypothetical protein